MPDRWRIVERHRVEPEGVSVYFILDIDNCESDLSVREAASLAADLVLAVDQIDPGLFQGKA